MAGKRYHHFRLILIRFNPAEILIAARKSLAAAITYLAAVSGFHMSCSFHRRQAPQQATKPAPFIVSTSFLAAGNIVAALGR